MIKKSLAGITGFFAVLILISGAASAATPYQSGATGIDVSYPNCNSNIPKANFGVVGAEDGLGFSQNPCLSSEASHFSNLSLYANSGYPGASSTNAQKYMSSPIVCASSDLNCIAYDYGYNQGLYAFNYAANSNVHAATWWLDVENTSTWTTDTLQNQNSLLGEHDALIHSGAVNVGAYSTTAQWNSITGTWHNGWPSWGATTWTTASQAQTYCTGHQFTGGPSWLMQYKSRRSQLDSDVAC